MNADKNNLENFFKNTSGISRDNVRYYVGWLNRFLEYFNGSLDDVSEGDVKAFGDFLESRGHEVIKCSHRLSFGYFLLKSLMLLRNSPSPISIYHMVAGSRIHYSQ